MSELAHSQSASHLDPFNWKFPSRKDLMSLSVINPAKDGQRLKTAVGLRTNRRNTESLTTQDIRGKFHRLTTENRCHAQGFHPQGGEST